ncbi:conjugal transfer protein TraD [Flavobacterium collinsii]|uniref:conjugal transfer protein TraD n=1 Tax=Flavobacterium collinsii TaxID=1114861 RepID=UPI0037580C04
METIIVICLLIIIALLMQDRITVNKGNVQKKPIKKKVSPEFPDILGQPKLLRSLSMPNTANESQKKELEIIPDNLDIEYDENETLSIQIPQEELDEVFSNMPDLEEEEEEQGWNRYGISGGDNSLAQGVTYEELSSIGALIQKENLEKAQKETVVMIVQKLQGTELFSLLENSMEGASRKIAELLDNNLSTEAKASSSSLRKNKLSDFNIEEFV